MNFLFAALTLLAMQIGRALVALISEQALKGSWGSSPRMSITYIFTLVILWIAARLDGMLEDQKHYLARVNEPRDHEGGVR